MPSQQNIGPQPIAEDVTPADLISADADNALVEGTDDKLFVPEGGGITNSAPANTIPLSDGTNLVDSGIAYDALAVDGPAFIATVPNGQILIAPGEDGVGHLGVTGLGAQLIVQAADGDADHVGGELSLNSGNSAGQGGGQLNIIAGSDNGEADGGSVLIQSGNASDGADNGGDSGDISIQVGGGNVADSDGGSVNISGGQGRTGGGSVIINAAARTVSGSHGTVQIYSADQANALDVSNAGLTVIGPVGFYGGAPAVQPVIPASPNAQDIADVLVALGLATQTP